MNSSRLALGLVGTQRGLVLLPARRSALHPSLGARKRPSHGLYTQPALILLTHRHLSTDAATRSGSSTGNSGSGSPAAPPPPGFNADEAKKPIVLQRDSSVAKSAKVAAKRGLETVVEKSAAAAAAAGGGGGEKAEAEVGGGDKTATAVVPVGGEKAVATGEVKKEGKKTTVWQKVKHGVQHFWDGTKLLGVEIKISSHLALKMGAGYELSRRERRQLERTVKDLGRLVPFSVFIIVPAGELFLPIALKFFPNLLPSTYEDQKAKDLKSSKLRSTRKDVSSFLRTTMREGGIQLSAKTRQREEFAQFFKKIRTSAEPPNHEDVIKVCKIFRDDLTLDNLSRAQLVGMCRYMNLNTFGTDAILRYNIRHRMRQIKRDDRAISYEGVDSLSVPELQTACASRGIRTHGVSPGRLRDDLNTWLELRLKHGLPSTLLVLSNAFMYQGKDNELESHYDALVAVLSSIPEELYHEIELEVNSAEGAATNRQRLEVLREQQELIEEENEQRAEGTEKRGVKDDQDIDEREEAREAREAKEKQG